MTGRDTNLNGYYFIAPFSSDPNAKAAPSLGLIDKYGDLVWYRQMRGSVFDFKYHQKAGIFSYAEGNWTGLGSKWYTMDQGFNMKDSLVPQDAGTDNHEFLVLENGNLLMAGLNTKTIDCSTLNLKEKDRYGDTASTVVGFVMQEFTPQGELVFNWSSFDHAPVTESFVEMGYEYENWRYAQGNSIDEDTDGNLLVSFRCLCSVYKIDRKTGEVIWRLGGKSSDFEFVNDEGFSAQHDARRLPNGNISLFDNNNLGGPDKASRAVEYKLDPDAKTATKVWEYLHGKRPQCSAIGNYQVLDKGHRLINWGNCKRPLPSASLLDQNDSLLFDLTFDDNFISYRVSHARLPFELNRPIVIEKKKRGKMILKCVGKHESYLWSNGKTSRTITLEGPGVYKVWVPKGSGWVSSAPRVIE